MSIDLMQSVGQQIHMTIDEFAQALATGTVYGLAVRFYEASHFTNSVLAEVSDHQYHEAVWKPDAVKLAEYIQSLDEVNDEFEYIIAYSPERMVEKYVPMSFTREGDTVLVEIH